MTYLGYEITKNPPGSWFAYSIKGRVLGEKTLEACKAAIDKLKSILK